MKKELAKEALKDASGLVKKWIGALVTHLYWCATSTPDGNPDIIEAKYLSIVNHIANCHKHDSPLFPRCAHSRKKKGQKQKEYFKKGTENKILKVLLFQDLVAFVVAVVGGVWYRRGNTDSLQSCVFCISKMY